MVKKIFRLFYYSIKGNYSYAFSQFEYTTYLRRKILHKRFANNTEKNSNAVVFDLQNAKDRYAFNIINTFKLANFDIYLKPNYKLYVGSKGLYFEDIFTFLNVGLFENQNQLKNYTKVCYISDYDNDGLPGMEYTSIRVDCRGAIEAQTLKFPFGFHPSTYKRFDIKTKEQLEEVLFTDEDNDQNAYRIMFAGSTHSEDYNKIKIKFPELVDRNSVFDMINTVFKKELTHDFSDVNPKPILISNSLDNIVINEIELFQIMKKSDFFIAPPGFEMPFCHNLYEAMSCGAIPIIQYGNNLFPNLEDQVNCLSFENLNQLEECIAQALTMEASEISRMKANVLDYYKNYMMPSTFVHSVMNTRKTADTVFYVAGGC